MNSNFVLFWPGHGKNSLILNMLLSVFKEKGYLAKTIPFEYDKGSIPFYSNSKWNQWILKHPFKWWIGISLGASLAYTFASLLDQENKPVRITMINPFASRRILSVEKGFSLDGQWDFSPINYSLKIHHIDMIISTNDKKIPIYHGITLFNKIISHNKYLIFINDEHQIKNTVTQKILAKLLIDKDKRLHD